MRAAGLKVRCKRKFRSTTHSSHRHPVAENLLNRDFTADRPNQKWITDITSLPAHEIWIAPAVVMELFSSTIVGWAMRKTLYTELVVAALTMAQHPRHSGQGMLHHPDQGIHSASGEYQQALERLGALQRMSRQGKCWDNAAIESFSSTLKLELDLHKSQGNRAETVNLVFEIDVFSNRERRHSSLGNRSSTRCKAHQAKPN
jgi:putative transposase